MDYFNRRALALATALALVAAIPARGQEIVIEDWWKQLDVAGKLVAVDASGDIYVAGPGATVQKLDPAGTVLWDTSSTPPTTGNEVPFSLFPDASNGVYVVFGASDSSGSTPQFGVLRLEAATGATSWLSLHQPPNGGTAWPQGAAIDAQGNVYVTGQARYAGSGYDDFYTVKFGPDGTVLWTSRYSTSPYDWSSKVAVDPDGNLIMSGSSWVPRSGIWDPDCFIQKLDGSTGVQIWTNRYTGAPDRVRHGEYCNLIAFDAGGDVYLAGSEDTGDNTTYSSRSLLMRLASDTGQIRWLVHGEGTPVTGRDWWQSIAADASGAVYLTGGVEGGVSMEASDCATAKYSPDGVLLWQSIYGNADAMADWCGYLALDAIGGVYAVGVSSTPVYPYQDTTVLRYEAASGALLWRSWGGSAIQSRPFDYFDAAAATPGGDLFTISGNLLVKYSANSAPAPLVPPDAVSRVLPASEGSRLVEVHLVATGEEVHCTLRDSSDRWNIVTLANGQTGTFFYRTNYPPPYLSCTFDDVAGTALPVDVEVSFRAKYGSNQSKVRFTFDASIPHQEYSYSPWREMWDLRYPGGVVVYTFDGTGSSDPDGGPILSWEWRVLDAAGATLATLTDRVAAHRFTSGAYTVVLTVTDDDGRTASATTALQL